MKPIIAITMGDPAGIAPELIARVLAQRWPYELCCPVVVGDASVMQEASRTVGANLEFEPVEDLAQAHVPPVVDVLTPKGLHIDRLVRGRVDPAMGEVAASCLRTAAGLALAGQIQGMISGTMNKEAFHLAGYDYSDELVYLGELTHSPEPFIMGIMGDIWTIAVTEHIPFRQIIDLVKKDKILWHIVKMDAAMRRAGLDEPKIGVAALNVHAGEGGLYGREEIDEIAPAIHEAQAQGIHALGPVPADMIFVRALAGDFNGVVCMYHDQANIARKLQPKSQGATIFMGLPVPCGTTAHGTAFDIAGRGIADPGSLEAALRHTARLASPASGAGGHEA